MNNRIVIVDDDYSICQIISDIIEENSLGVVVGLSGDGNDAENILNAYQPDVAIIDLLLPGQDGIELMKKTRDAKSETSFIMISENRTQPLITEAYEHGCEFYIHKPINVLEVVSIINKVIENRQMKKALSFISQTTAKFKQDGVVSNVNQFSDSDMIYEIFLDLGIVGDAGSKIIHKIIILLKEYAKRSHMGDYQLKDIYLNIANGDKHEAKNLDQRVRRTVAKALNNIAHQGIDDYGNENFQRYSSALFDFGEIRQEMNCIIGKSCYHGKINAKKFIEGLILLGTRNFDKTI